MNVHEINQSGPPVSAFAITAIVMLAISGLTWTFWRTFRNIKLAYRVVKQGWHSTEKPTQYRILRETVRKIDAAFMGRNSDLFDEWRVKRLDAIWYWLGICALESRLT
jgi:hypothetical protein